jgi:hypothetical protein
MAQLLGDMKAGGVIAILTDLDGITSVEGDITVWQPHART